MKVLVTGATGLIGGEVATLLAGKGYEVIATGRKAQPKAAKLPVPIHQLDLFDREGTARITKGVDAVVHMANLVGWTEKDLTVGVLGNMRVHLNIIQAAVEAGVKKLIFAGSVHIFNALYPDGSRVPDYHLPYLPLDGKVPPCPVNPYGMSKQFCETILAYVTQSTGMTTVAVRIPLVVPHDRTEDLASGRVKPYPGAVHDGFSFLSLRDCGTLVEAILRSPLQGHHVFFPTSRRNVLGLPPAEVIKTHYANVPLRRPLEEFDSLVDTSEITRQVGWSPRD